MDEEEFRASLSRAIARHARDAVSRGVWTAAEADAASISEFDQLLPRGWTTPGFHFRKVVQEQDGATVGETWFNVRKLGGKVQLWIDWLWVDPDRRRQGIATEALRLLEEEARNAGADRMGLHVLADNTAAIELYTRLGYTSTSVRMTRPLNPRG